MKALVLAAGLGTRLRPYTYITPKPLFTVNGITILDRIIGQLAKAGCREIMVNTHHLPEMVEDHISRMTYSSDVKTVYEPLLLDTGGAVKNLEHFWDDEPFFVVNSDIFTDFDFSEIYRYHLHSGAGATLLLHDDPRFNNVRVENTGLISAFRTNGSENSRIMAFTGIQVVSPVILDAIPVGTPFSIIDAYRNLVSSGEKIAAFIPENFMWEDIGKPETYKNLSKHMLTEKTFGCDFSSANFKKLKGDGSDRQWSRVSVNGKNLVLAEHGIKNTAGTCEAESFVKIGRHLYSKGIPVPEIKGYDITSGHVFVEDLGDTHLADYVNDFQNSRTLTGIYKKIIKHLLDFSKAGFEGFNPSWAWQTAEYSKKMIMEKECLYFSHAFIKNYLGLEADSETVAPVFEKIADIASSSGFKGLMHRDCQSKNIMIKNGKPYFIDFQGARKGPFQYDLASLLIDPYVNLQAEIVYELEEFAFSLLSRYSDKNEFRKSLNFCKVARNLQILGAFAFLSSEKNKTYFEKFIPVALQSLDTNLSAIEKEAGTKPLKKLVLQAQKIMQKK